jgi:hypothetical protein
MFGISFTKSDLVRAIWTFLFGVAGYVAVTGGGVPDDWKAFAAGAVMAGLSAVKNLVLKDGTTLKG